MNNSFDNDSSISRSTSRSSSVGTRGISTGFRSNFYSSASNPRFTSKSTEAERKLFNDFVELAYASACTNCADNTMDREFSPIRLYRRKVRAPLRYTTMASGRSRRRLAGTSTVKVLFFVRRSGRGRPHAVSVSSQIDCHGMQGDAEFSSLSAAWKVASQYSETSASSFNPVSPAPNVLTRHVRGVSVGGNQAGAQVGEKNRYVVSTSSSTLSSTVDIDQDTTVQTPTILVQAVTESGQAKSKGTYGTAGRKQVQMGVLGHSTLLTATARSLSPLVAPQILLLVV